MNTRTHARAPIVTLAAYLTLAGSVAFAMSASAGQAAVDDHAQHNCVTDHSVTEVAQDGDANSLHQNAAHPVEPAEASAAQNTQASAKPAKRARRKNQVESALFHFSF